jgi:O-antigen/teichoic acid export membrane protein
MSRTRPFLQGVGFGYANQFLVTVVGLWLTPFLLHRIGQEQFGLWLVGGQILTYLGLADLGIVALLPRATAYATGRARSIEAATLDLPEIIGHTAGIVIYQTIFVAIASIAVWVLMPAEWFLLRLPLGLVMATFVLTFPLRIFQAVLQGLQQFSFLGKLVTASWLIATAITILLVFAAAGLYALAIGWVAGQVFTTSACYLYLRSRFPDVLPRRLPNVSVLKMVTQIRQGLWVSVAQLAQALVNGTDLLIIGRVLGPLAVVPYACTGKLVTVLSNQPQMLMQTAGPGLSEMKMAESRQKLFQVCTALTHGVLIISGAVVCTVLIVNQGFVSWWVGAGQYGGVALTVLLLLTMFLRHWNTTAVYAIFCFGYERQISVTTLLDGLVTTCAAIAFVREFGLVGAPIGSILGVCTVSLPANLSALARENGVTLIILIKSLWPWFGRFALLLIATLSVARIYQPHGFFTIAITVVATATAYGLVMLPIALQGPLGIYVRPQLSGIWFRIRSAQIVQNADV